MFRNRSATAALRAAQAFTTILVVLFGASNASAALIGSINHALYGYSAPLTYIGEPALGVTIGFTACPGGIGTNIYCNTISGISPQYMFENIGLIFPSSSVQSFTQDALTAPSFNDIVGAMSAGLFNFSYAHRIETQDSVGIPLEGGSYGGAGPSSNLEGYWLGATIESVVVKIDPFAFRPKDFGPSNGGLVQELYNPAGDEYYGTDRLVKMTYEFYGTRGIFQDGPPTGAVPEPSAWILLIGGFGLAGGMLRRRRAVAA